MVFGAFLKGLAAEAASDLKGLAAEAASDYIKRRGIGGIIEDAGNLKNKVTDMFSGNSKEEDYDDEEYYDEDEGYSQNECQILWDKIDEFIEKRNFKGAENYLSTFVGKEKDDLYYYAMAYIYNIKAVADDSIEDERKAKNFINNAISMLEGDTDWRNSVFNLRKQIEENLDIFKKEGGIESLSEKEFERIERLDTIEYDIHELIETGNLSKASELTQMLKEDEAYYTRVSTRVDSLILLSMVTDGNPSKSEVRRKIFEVEDMMRRACNFNKEVADKIQEAAEERIAAARQYLEGDLSFRKTHAKQTQTSSTPQDLTESESEYAEEFKACMEDGVISDKERRLLDRLRRSLGISEARAKELEAIASGKSELTESEKEYLDEYKVCLEDDGVISDRERRLLDRLAKSLGIAPYRAAQIEKMIVK